MEEPVEISGNRDECSAIRHLEEAGFTHTQAAGLIEVIQDDVLDQVATKEFVELTSERVKNEVRSEIHALRDELKGDIHVLRNALKGDIHALGTDFGNRHISLLKWLCGIAIVQTASIIFGAVGLIEILK
jgi:hypothetical protein